VYDHGYSVSLYTTEGYKLCGLLDLVRW